MLYLIVFGEILVIVISWLIIQVIKYLTETWKMKMVDRMIEKTKKQLAEIRALKAAEEFKEKESA